MILSGRSCATESISRVITRNTSCVCLFIFIKRRGRTSEPSLVVKSPVIAPFTLPYGASAVEPVVGSTCRASIIIKLEYPTSFAPNAVNEPEVCPYPIAPT